jgi:DNA-binding IclR family transcriptional regulator
VVSFLAAHPGQGHTLTELAQALDVNPSSMHGILGVMTEAGFLVRHPVHRTYRLGLVTAAVGQVALGHDPVLELALEEVARLNDDFAMESVVVTAAGGEMVVVARSGPSTGRLLSFVGQRALHAPPFGSIFVAWADATCVSAWLARAEPALDPPERHGYEEALDVVRATGLAIVLVADRQWHFGAPADSRHRSARNGLVRDLDRKVGHRIFYIGCPVFDAHGDVAVGLFVNGPPRRLPVDRIDEIAQRLADAATRIMNRTGGRVPVAPASNGAVRRTRPRT